MSYIVPREKPKCYNCPFRTLDYCGLLIEHDCVTVNVNEMTVSEYCPLIEIPTPHGRLIDADEFKADYDMKNDCADCEKELNGKMKSCEYDRIYSKMDFCEWLDYADTVIEAEGREE